CEFSSVFYSFSPLLFLSQITHTRFPFFTHSRINLCSSMAAWMVASRQVASLSRLSSSTTATTAQASKLIQRRGLSGGGDHHGPPKVDFWKDPTSPSKWKEEHFVIVSLTGWGCLLYGGYKLFTKGKVDKQEKEDNPLYKQGEKEIQQSTCHDPNLKKLV
ncbi:hypothetical protein AQUCO_10300011v1, partial [Aquilegia coerulea]